MTSILFPYPTMPDAQGTLSITEARLDGLRRPQLVKKDDSTVSLYADPKPWKKAALDIELMCDPNSLRAFEAEHGPVRAVIVADCSATSIRQRADLSRSEVDVGRWSGTLELDRDNVQDRVYLLTTLSAAVAGVADRRVGAAPSWTVYADEPESLRLRGTLQVKWLDFGGASAPSPARDFPRSTHVIAFTGGVPELWLNSGFEGLEALLKDRKDRRGAERGLHDFQRAGIARGAWMALLADALSAVTSDSDDEKTEPVWPEKQWQTEVLKLILPEVAPGKSERELLRMAGGEWQDSPGAGEFFSRAEAVIGDIVKANESLRRFVHSYRGEET